MGRLYAEVHLSVDDFKSFDLSGIIAGCRFGAYADLFGAFRKYEEKARNDGQEKKAKIAWLLAGACCMVLMNDEFDQPFAPYLQTYNSRSFMPENFTDEDIEFFKQIADLVEHDRLRARLSDLIYLRLKDQKNPQKRQFALTAIDAYRLSPIVDDYLFHQDGYDCWKRALSLATSFGKAEKGRLEEMAQILQSTLLALPNEKAAFGCRLSELLLIKHVTKSNHRAIAEKLVSLGGVEFSRSNYFFAEMLYVAAEQWFTIIHLKQKVEEVRRLQALCYAHEGINKLKGVERNYLVGGSYLKNALFILESLSADAAEAFGATDLIKNIEQLLIDISQIVSSNLSTIKAKPIVIEGHSEKLKQFVAGAPINDGIYKFLNTIDFVQQEQLYARVLEDLKSPCVSHLIPREIISEDGCVRAKQKPLIPALNDTFRSSSKRNINSLMDIKPGDNQTIDQEAFRNYLFEVQLQAQIWVLPMLENLKSEYGVETLQNRLGEMLQMSKILPQERFDLISDGLLPGLIGDFVKTSLYAIPQIEEILRYNLKKIGCRTTRFQRSSNDSFEGIEVERTLKQLLDLDEAKQVFGSNVVFELQALLCSPFGANLRNGSAHGLLNEKELGSNYVVYLWWLMLKLLLTPVFTSVKKNN